MSLRRRIARRATGSLVMIVAAGCSLRAMPPTVHVALSLSPDAVGPTRFLALPTHFTSRDAQRTAGPATVDEMSCAYATMYATDIPPDATSSQVGGLDTTCLNIGKLSRLVPVSTMKTTGVDFAVSAGTRTLDIAGVYLGPNVSCGPATSLPDLYAGPTPPSIYSVAHVVTQLTPGVLSLPTSYDSQRDLNVLCNPSSNTVPASVAFSGGGDSPNATIKFLQPLTTYPPNGDDMQSMKPITIPPLEWRLKPPGGYHPRVELYFEIPGGTWRTVDVSISASAGPRTFDSTGGNCLSTGGGNISGDYLFAAWSPPKGAWLPGGSPDVTTGTGLGTFNVSETRSPENGRFYIHVAVKGGPTSSGSVCGTLLISEAHATFSP